MNVHNNTENFNLIPIYEEVAVGDSIQTVNARELHSFLGVRKDFTNWIKYQVSTFGFDEHGDYVVVAENGEQCYQGVTQKKEYFLSLDMAKEISMMSRCAKGKEARQYFIVCERKAKAQPVALDLNSPSQLRGLLSSYAERTEIAETRVAELAPKAEAFDQLDALEGALSIRPAAKVLSIPEGKLKTWLQLNRWAFRQSGKGPLQAYTDKRNTGYLDHKLHSYQGSDGEKRVNITLMVTPKGLKKLAKAFSAEAA